MKRLLATVLIAMILFANVGVAEEIDLSNYTTEELIELNSKIIVELHNRECITESYLYQGSYIVGEDFEEGRYIIECARVIDENIGYGKIITHTNEEKNVTHYQDLHVGDKYSVKLLNGYSLDVRFLECTLTKIK